MRPLSKPPRPSNYDGVSGIKLLSARIIHDAVEAYRNGDTAAGLFFYSDRFEILANALGLNIYVVREKLKLPIYEKLEAAPNLAHRFEKEKYKWIILPVIHVRTRRTQKTKT